MNLRKYYKTTELLLTVLFQVGVVASALAGSLPPKWAAIAAGIAQATYSLSRGLAKINAPAPPAA